MSTRHINLLDIDSKSGDIMKRGIYIYMKVLSPIHHPSHSPFMADFAYRFSTILNKGPRGSRKESSYLQLDSDLFLYPDELLTRRASGEGYDDAASVSIISTTATMDNIPGPGRLIDMYIYQLFGRKIERLANHICLSNLPPAKIAQCLWQRTTISSSTRLRSARLSNVYVHKDFSMRGRRSYSRFEEFRKTVTVSKGINN